MGLDMDLTQTSGTAHTSKRALVHGQTHTGSVALDVLTSPFRVRHSASSNAVEWAF
jgi:hypothetical protein